MNGRISISFSVSYSYAQHLAVVLTSMIVNNPGEKFVFHVLHRDFSIANQMKCKELVSGDIEIKFHKIDESAFARFPLPPHLEHVTQETYYRYILPDVLADEDRTIYSDVDVICSGKLRPLFETDLSTGGGVYPRCCLRSRSRRAQEKTYWT